MEFGKRLLPQVVDHHAQHDPHRVYASIPRSSSDLAHGFRDIPMAHLAAMVDRIAWWLDGEVLGRGRLDAVAYLGPADIRYAVLFLAAVKVGYKMLFISPRNQPAQNQNMLKRSGCVALFYAEELSTAALPLAEALPGLTSRPVIPLADLLDGTDGSGKRYPYDKSFAEARDEPCLILHSSGSTGDPKLVTMTHGTFAVTDNDRNMPVPEGRKAQNADQFNFPGGGRFYSCFPPYHLAGVHAYIDLPIFSTSATVVFGPTQLPPSGYLLSEILQRQPERVRAFYVPPFIIEQWFAEPPAAEQAPGLDFVLYGGGPLSGQVGDKLSEVTNVCQMYGSLEVGQVQMLVPKKTEGERPEWSYMELNPYEEADMQPAGEDGVYEMVLHQDGKLADRRSLWHNFPGVKEWRTGDLFIPHPQKKGLWRFHSRVDDLIVLSSSHKIRPLEMETIIQGDPLLSGALICGQGKPEPLLIVEPKPQAYEEVGRGDLVDRIWPTVEEANKIAPTYARLTRSRVLVARPEVPFIRAPKGSIVRKLTVKAYEDDIEAAYGGREIADAHINGVTPAQGAIVPFLLPGVKDFIRQHAQTLLRGIAVSDSDNLFLLGLDSLGCIGLSRHLAEGITVKAGQGPSFSPRIVYKYPTIEALAPVVLSMMLGVTAPDTSTTTTNVAELKQAVEEFTKDLPPPSGSQNTAQPTGLVVALLGPRGSLGPHIVHQLLSNPLITKIYCLSRGPDGRDRLRTLFKDLNMPCSADDERLDFFPVDLGKPRLGLADDHHAELLRSVHLVIHNAWKVDFSWTLESYKPVHLRGVRDLVDFAAASPLGARIVYISSVASVQAAQTGADGAGVKEAPPESYEVASPLGYGQSKHVAERILAQAARESRVPVSILRLGQVGGPTTVDSGGRWSLDEWLPALTAISVALGVVPSDLPPIDWLPVDVVAKVVGELATGQSGGDGGGEAEVFNLVNPQLSDWGVYKGVLQEHSGGKAAEVPLTEWVRQVGSTKPDILEARGVTTLVERMLPFFEHLVEISGKGVPVQPRFETRKAVKGSDTMATLGPVDKGLVEVWFKQWGF